MSGNENSTIDSFVRLRNLRVGGDQVLPVKPAPSFVPGSTSLNGSSLNIRDQNGNVVVLSGGGLNLNQVTNIGNTTDQQMIINRTGSILTLDSASVSSSTGLSLTSDAGNLQLGSTQSDIILFPRSGTGTGQGVVTIQGKNPEGGAFVLQDTLILTLRSPALVPTVVFTFGLGPFGPFIDPESNNVVGGVTVSTVGGPFTITLQLAFAPPSGKPGVQVTAKNDAAAAALIGATTSGSTVFSIFGTTVGPQTLRIAYFIVYF